MLVSGYFLVTIGLYVFQDKFIFQSTVLEPTYTFNFDQPFNEVNIKEGLSGIIFNPKEGVVKGAVLYFHGNADNMQRWGNYAVDFTNLGYQVIMIDYSGFGKSHGISNEEVLYQNAEDTWQWAQHHLKAKKFIIYGRSLGTGVAAHLAANHKANQLILETPFYQLKQARLAIFFPFGLKYKFPTYQYISKVDYPISVIQGTNDWIVSMSSAKKLEPLLKPTDSFFVIEGGAHKNLRDFDEYHKILKEIL